MKNNKLSLFSMIVKSFNQIKDEIIRAVSEEGDDQKFIFLTEFKFDI